MISENYFALGIIEAKDSHTQEEMWLHFVLLLLKSTKKGPQKKNSKWSVFTKPPVSNTLIVFDNL